MPHLVQKPKYHIKNKILKSLADFFTPSFHNINAWKFKNKFLRKTGLTIGLQVVIDKKFYILEGCENNLSIGDYSVINRNCTFMAYNTISIGSFCMVACDALFINGGHNKNTYEPYSSPITIKNGVWIGTRATLLARENGLTIGNNAIIGANSLVINSIPENAIVAGNPAKIIGYRTLPHHIRHIGNIYYDPKNFHIVNQESLPIDENESKMKSDIINNSILKNYEKQNSDTIEFLGVRVTNKDGVDTMSVDIGEELNFYIYAKALRYIPKPYFGIAVYQKNNKDLLFVGTTVQIDDYSIPLNQGDEIVVGFKVKMTVEAGLYYYRLSCAEPLQQYHPNKGSSLIAYDMLGPICVNFDYENKRAPFYGIAQLPMEML